MPSNLNALVRYKQIDKCLRNKYVNCTIEKMQKLCSEQLGEHRGVYKQVSERTIRDDIKTMRGDALGFNAPIVVKNGVYSYDDENFSIFKSSIDDMELLKDVMKILLEEKDKIENPKLKKVLSALSMKTGITLPTELVEEDESAVKEFEQLLDQKVCYSIGLDADDDLYNSISFGFFNKAPKKVKTSLYSWKDILELL